MPKAQPTAKQTILNGNAKTSLLRKDIQLVFILMWVAKRNFFQ